MNQQAFCEEILQLREETTASIDKRDFYHLRRIKFINTIFLIIGTATAWVFPNPISMICLSLWLTNRWCIVAHHVLHGGMDKIKGLGKS